jgi:tripartite-type tricarboxylate transporter receptor subunit TctC
MNRPSTPAVANPTRRRFSRALAGGALLIVANGRAAGDGYPSRTIKVIAGQTPGGPTDLLARLVAHHLSDRFRENVVVENHGGAAGTIAARMVAAAPPDGYTLLLGSSGSLALAAARTDLGPYDPIRDFALITRIARVGYVFVVRPGLNATTLAQVVSSARILGRPMTIATVGVGSNSSYATAQFARASGLAVTDVAYKGGAPGIQAVVAGEIDGTFVDLTTVRALAASGSLRIIAACGRKRLALAPEIPTFVEGGYPGVVAEPWYGVVAPAGTPPSVIATLTTAMHAMLAEPAVAQRFAGLGYEAIVESSEEFGAAIRAEVTGARALAANDRQK